MGLGWRDAPQQLISKEIFTHAYMHAPPHRHFWEITLLGSTPNPSSRSSLLPAKGRHVRDRSWNAVLGVFGGVAPDLRSSSHRKPVPACSGNRRELNLHLLTSPRLPACALVPRCSPCLPPISLPICPSPSKTAPYSASEDSLLHTTFSQMQLLHLPG